MSWGLNGEMAGARLGAVFGPCSHTDVEPVELYTGEVVSSVCVRCLVRLPASWGCEDCSYVDDTRLCSPVPTRTMGERCSKHQQEWRP